MNSMINIYTSDHPAEQALERMGGIRIERLDDYRSRMLRRQLETHKYWKNSDRQEEMSWNEAAESWLEESWKPVLRAMDETGIRRKFPDRSDWDLYVEVSEHWHFLKRSMPDLSAEDAAGRYAAWRGWNIPGIPKSSAGVA